MDWFTDVVRQIPHGVAYVNLAVGMSLGIISLLFWTLKQVGSSFGGNSSLIAFSEAAGGQAKAIRVGEVKLPLMKMSTTATTTTIAEAEETPVAPLADPPPSPPGEDEP